MIQPWRFYQLITKYRLVSQISVYLFNGRLVPRRSILFLGKMHVRKNAVYMQYVRKIYCIGFFIVLKKNILHSVFFYRKIYCIRFFFIGKYTAFGFLWENILHSVFYCF